MRPLLAIAILLCCSCRSASPVDTALSRMVPFGLSGSILVADRNGILLDKAYGDDLRPDTIYDMGSITKSFTATAILMLEADGKLSVDDTLAKHFTNVPADKANITLRQMMAHSSGLVDLTGGDYDRVSREQLIADVFAAPLVAAPGAEYHYSNAAFSLLAAIIEKVSGKPYMTFMRERLFAPAGMRDTGYEARERHRVARTYTPPVDHGTPLERLERSGGVHWVLLGNGGMLSTTQDLYRWELALRRGEIVSHDVQKKMFTPQLVRKPYDLAFAWGHEVVDGERVLHHGSDAPELGVNGEFRRYPDQGVAIIFLGNSRINGWSPRRAIGPLVRRILRGETIDVPATVPVKATELQRYAGVYTLADGSSIDVRVERDHLVAGAVGQSAIDLLTVQKNESSLANRRKFNAEAAKLLPNATILGTSRRDRGVFMTTIREGNRVLRFAWEGGKPVLESDDGALPHSGFLSESPIRFALERPFRRERSQCGAGALAGDCAAEVGGATSSPFAFYDIAAGETIRASFAGDTLTIGAITASRAPR